MTQSLKRSLGSGVFYTALAKYSGIVISIGIGAVLSRLLTPEEFGIVALVTVFVTFFSLLSDFGIGPAVVQNQQLTEEDISSIYSFTIYFGIILGLLFFFSAPLVSNFYDEPKLINISRLLSLSVLFNSFLIIPSAILQKQLKFKLIGLLSITIQLISGILGIIMAFSGFSYYALIIPSIISSAILSLVYCIYVRLKFTFLVQKKSILKIIKFSSFQFLFNIINYFSRNLDNILIGKYMGSSELGYYNKSYSLMLMPVQNLTHVITPVLMPILSKYQDNKSFVFKTYLRLVEILALIGFPLSIFLYFSAGDIIYFFFGDQWGNSIPVFKILALSIGIQIILSSSGSIFQVVNRTDMLFLSGLLSALTMVGGFVFGIFVGRSLIAVGFSLLISFTLNFFQCYYLLIRITLKESLIIFFKTLLFPIFISVCLAVILWITQYIIPSQHLLSLLMKATISIIGFVSLFSLKKENRAIIKSGIEKIKNYKKNK